MRKIKIIFALEAAEGGALKHLVYLISGLGRGRFDITVILSNSRGQNICREISTMKESGATVHIFPMHRSIRPFSDLCNLIRLHVLLKNGSFDIAHAHSSKAGVLLRLAAWINSVPLVLYTPHCFYFQALKGLPRYGFALIEKVMAKLTSYIIVSNGEKEEALNARICSVDKLRNINNAIAFTRKPMRQSICELKRNFDITSKFVVGSVGRLTRQKNWEMFIRTANEVLRTNRDVTFVICGDGELRKKLENMVKSFGINDRVRFLGYTEDVEQVYQIIDVYVNTSDWEGLPYTILEAIHHKKAIVVTDAIRDRLLRDRVSSYVVSKRDYIKCSNRINHLLRDQYQRLKFSRNCQKEIRQYRYSFKRFIQAHDTIYSSILKPSIFVSNVGGRAATREITV